MRIRRLNVRIAICLAFVLGGGMLLVDFVGVMVLQNALIRSAISRAALLSSIFESHLTADGPISIPPDTAKRFRDLLNVSDIQAAMIVDMHANEIYFHDAGSVHSESLLKQTALQGISTGKMKTSLEGSAWGIFWRQHRNVLLSVPIFHENKLIAGGAMVIPLSGIYETLRKTQPILLGYILINIIILSAYGTYNISKITVKPIRGLLDRAESYSDEDAIFFNIDKRDTDEFSQLTRALNRMLHKISKNKKALQATVRSLETANTNLKNAQQEIINAEKLASVGRLSAGIAHEIGNPIAIIIGYLDLLKHSDTIESERIEYIRRTENEINKINGIINQMLDLSRPSSGDLTPASIHGIIQEVIQITPFHPMLSKLKINLDFKTDSDIVYADPSQLRQVFLNLMVNAADAIEAKHADPFNGFLNIETEKHRKDVSSHSIMNGTPSQEFIEVSFVDNGVGIPGDQINKIFDPFFTTKEPGKGTGLGLSVCYMIIKALKGDIQVRNMPDTGTTRITLILPLHSESCDP